jgi:hypothetical protein
MAPLELVICPKEQDNRRLKEIQLKSHSPPNYIIIEQFETSRIVHFSPSVLQVAANPSLFCLICHTNQVYTLLTEWLSENAGLAESYQIFKVNETEIFIVRKCLHEKFKKVKGRIIHPLVMDHDPAKAAQ